MRQIDEWLSDDIGVRMRVARLEQPDTVRHILTSCRSERRPSTSRRSNHRRSASACEPPVVGEHRSDTTRMPCDGLAHYGVSYLKFAYPEAWTPNHFDVVGSLSEVNARYSGQFARSMPAGAG